MEIARPDLRIVDTDTGELLDTCPSCKDLQAQLDGAERDIRAWRTRYANLARDKDAEAEQHDFFPRANRLFDYWREATGHLNCKWTPARFWVCLPSLKHYDDKEIERAIAGIAYDPYTNPRKKGGVEKYDMWETLFKETGNIESYANKAPVDYCSPLRAPYTKHAKDVAKFILDRARVIEETDDGVEIARVFVEIDRRNNEWLRQGNLKEPA